MEMITGYKSNNKTNDFSTDFVEELNTFHGRFEVHDFQKQNDHLKCYLEYLIWLNDSDRICVSEEEVKNVLRKVKINKASGPDGIRKRVFKLCRQQLAPLLCNIFQMCFDTGDIPRLWKTSTIIPIPKGSKARELNARQFISAMYSKC